LRFWFRALAGGLLGESLENVWQAESALYGNTQRASSVAVLMAGQPRTEVSVAGSPDQLPGIAYLFWSVFQQKRDAIAVGERFHLWLRVRPYPFAPVDVAGRTRPAGE
jgi:CRISPR/Cas system CMR-associated protein Cmr1 (group 7 of RAMP superfamily)